MPILHSVEFGSGPETVVFIGSLGSTTDMWLPQLDELSNTHRVIAIDHRGHGQSPVLVGPCTVADMADDVLETLNSRGVEKFSVVGLSLGGAVAQYLAATCSRVDKAVFMCTAAKFGTSESWLERAAAVRENGLPSIAGAIVDRWFSPGFLATMPATTDLFFRMITSTSDEGYISACEALAEWDFRSRLGEITVPALTIAGADDPSTPPAILQEIADGLSGPVRVEVLSPAAHVPTVERPSEVNRLLKEFLS